MTNEEWLSALFAEGEVYVRYSVLRKTLRHNDVIKRLEGDGLFEKVGAGIYGLPSRDPTYDSIAVIGLLHPDSVICLESAAVLHGITDANPFDVHVACKYTKRTISNNDLSVKCYKWKDQLLSIGVEEIALNGVKIKVTSKARTVVDFLRRIQITGMPEESLKVLKAYIDEGNRPSELIKIAERIGATASKTIEKYVQATMNMRGP